MVVGFQSSDKFSQAPLLFILQEIKAWGGLGKRLLKKILGSSHVDATNKLDNSICTLVHASNLQSHSMSSLHL